MRRILLKSVKSIMGKKIRRILWKPVRSIFLKWADHFRYVIEKKIFPLIKNKKVLLVGCAYYVEDYPKKLKKNNVYSIDINPKMAEFGAKKHIVGSVTELTKYFQKDFFDVVFFGGVIGWGLNKTTEVEKALEECYSVLKEKGVLILWWNDDSGHNQVVPERLKNYKLFTPISLAGMKSGYREYRVEGDVVLDFLRKEYSHLIKDQGYQYSKEGEIILETINLNNSRT